MADPHMDELLAAARYARERYDLYKARMFSDRPSRLSRLRELERLSEQAESRLRRAQAADRYDPPSARRITAPHQTDREAAEKAAARARSKPRTRMDTHGVQGQEQDDDGQAQP